MQVPESSFESYKSKEINFCLTLNVSLSFSVQSVRKEVSAICHIQFQ